MTSRRNFVHDALTAVAAVVGLSMLDVEPALAQIAALPARNGDAAKTARYPIPAADGVSFDPENDVIVARNNGSVYAFSLSCPHQNTALKWLKGDNRFQCPKHKSKYQPDGTFISGRATRSMDRLGIKRDGNFVVVEAATLIRSDEQAAEWAAAVVKL